jgi:hypothetical protein
MSVHTGISVMYQGWFASGPSTISVLGPEALGYEDI